MATRILYFAQLVDRLGLSAETLDIPPAVSTAGELLAHLRARGPQWAEALADDAVNVMVNRQFASLDAPVSGALEIAISPARRR